MDWVEVKTRSLTNEEKELYFNTDFTYDCVLPNPNEEVLVTLNDGKIALDSFEDYGSFGLGFCNYTDEGMVVAWMRLPEPFSQGCGQN